MISQSRLESYLWDAATLLRGYIDAEDYKQFIFPLQFYKWLCDVYDEEPAKCSRGIRGESVPSPRIAGIATFAINEAVNAHFCDMNSPPNALIGPPANPPYLRAQFSQAITSDWEGRLPRFGMLQHNKI